MEWVKSGMAEMKEDLKVLKNNQVMVFEKIGELSGEIGQLRGELHSEISGLCGELRSEMHKEFANLHASITTMTRWILVGILAAVTLISLLHPLMNNWLVNSSERAVSPAASDPE